MASLKKIIEALPVGKSNAKKVSTFEKDIGNEPSGTNNDQTRKEVKNAIYESNIPIGSNSQKGYWLIDSDTECEEVTNRLNSTIQELSRKRDAIQKGWQKRKQSKGTNNPWPK